MQKQYFTYKAEGASENDIKTTPLDLLDVVGLIDDDVEIREFYECTISGDVLDKITLSDFINNQVKLTTNASSGYDAQNASSGNYAKNASSGYDAQNVSSGDRAQNASSGNYAKNASSGDYAQNASSGYRAQNASSGYGAQNASSGDRAQNKIEGAYSICFDCGKGGLIKGIAGTWIALAEYEKNEDGCFTPCYAATAQIGNADYKDCFNKVLSELYFYTLSNKQFVPIIIVDDEYMVVLSAKKKGEYQFYKTQYLDDFVAKNTATQFVAQNGNVTAHGKSIKEAMADVDFKKQSALGALENAKRVIKQNIVTPKDYKLITGACEYGTARWLEDNGLSWDEAFTVAKALEITSGAYGGETFKRLIEEAKQCT